MWIQNLTLLKDQGLWIQATILHCLLAKTASITVICDQGWGSSTFVIKVKDASSQGCPRVW